jgi:putative DNA primase/helicase
MRKKTPTQDGIVDITHNKRKKTSAASAKYEDRVSREDAGSISTEPCPITLLGFANGKHHFIGPKGHHFALSPAQLSSWSELLTLFGDQATWLIESFPPSRRSKSSLFDVQAATRWITQSSFAQDRTSTPAFFRKSGVWADKTNPNAVIVHLGKDAIIDGRKVPICAVSQHHGFALGDVELDWSDESGNHDDALRVGDAIKTFNFAAPEQKDLVIGWIGLSFFAGALKWRPHLFITAPRGSGKTTLISIIDAALGSIAFLAGQDATAAYIHQSLDGRACAALIDEAEAGDNGKVEAIMHIARCASDGDGAITGRGSAGGAAQSFFCAASFLFASIHAPILAPQDRTRVAQLTMDPVLPGSYRATDFDLIQSSIAKLKERAPHLLHYMSARWSLYIQTERAYRAILQDDHEMTPRFAMQASALLAGYDTLMLVEARSQVDVRARVDQMLPTLKTAMALEEAEPGEMVLQYLTSKTPTFIDLESRQTVGELIAEALNSPSNSQTSKGLHQLGLHLPRSHPKHIAIANNHAGLEQIFIGTEWTNGRWRQPLKQLEDVKPDANPTKVFGASTRVLLVPLKRLLPGQN